MEKIMLDDASYILKKTSINRNVSLKEQCASINKNWPDVMVFRFIIQLIKIKDGRFWHFFKSRHETI
jgi:hypothetical protein